MREIKIGAVLSYLKIFITLLVTVLFTPVLIHFLGKDEFGLYELVMVFVGYLTILDFGLGNTVVRYIAKNRVVGDQKAEARMNGFFLKLFSWIGLIAFVIGYVLHLLVDDFFGASLSPEQVEQAQVMVLIMAISLALQFPLSVFTSILEAYEKFIFIRSTAVLRVVLQPIVMLLFLINGQGVVTLTFAVAFIGVCNFILNAFICMNLLKVQFSFKKNEPFLVKKMLIFSFFIFLTVIVDKIFIQTNQLLVGIFHGTDDVAVFAVAVQFLYMFMSVAYAVNGLFLPRITMLTMDEDNVASLRKINELFVNVGAIQVVILGYVLGGFILFGREFIVLWVGQEFVPAYWIVVVLMIPIFVDLIQHVGISILKAKNLFKFRTITLFLLALVNLIVAIPVTARFGMVGSAIVSGAALFIGYVVLMNIYYYKRIGLDIFRFWRLALRFGGSIGIAMLSTWILIDTLRPEFNVSVLLGWIVVYSLILSVSIFVFGMNADQRRCFVRGVRKRIVGLRALQ
nr:oligosaccharide flippase family protein [Lysinibacillus timonensis]